MIQHLYNRYLISSLHRLRHFIVVDQNQLPRHTLQKIALGQNPHQPFVLIQHREYEIGRVRRDFPSGLQSSLRSKTREFCVYELINPYAGSGK